MKQAGGENSCLILGGTCELALSLAPMLMAEGIRPVMTWRNSAGQERIVSHLTNWQGQYETVHLDLSDSRSFTDIIPRAFDCLVDFAHGHYESLVSSADMERVGHYFAENVTARAVLLQYVTRMMLTRKKGRLVYVSSSAAERPAAGQGFYGAAKRASEALYQNCGLELGKRGITAAILRIGYVDAGRGRVFLREKPEAIKQIPVERPLTVQEVAEAILFLLSPGAYGINAS
ncbi:MAG: SDR family oxidoreductase, partial [Syntrophobacterales bacterium]|nr:SDR family oxidoreductase [Syntrophobacterales bacterium]